MKEFRHDPRNIPSSVEAFHDFAFYRDVRIPMSDGIELTANIFFPSKNGEVDLTKKYPVILSRSPYFTTNGETYTAPAYMHFYANELGYVFILCACRSTSRSGGVEFWPMQTEAKDSVDTLKWVREQPWCNGHVATCGGSYLGGNQYLMHLTGETEGVDASVIHVPAMNSFGGSWAYNGEFFDMDCAPLWAILMSIDQMVYKHIAPEDLKGLAEDNQLMGNPFGNPNVLRTMSWPALQAEHGLANIPMIRNVAFYRAFLENRDNPDYFLYNDAHSRKHDMNMPLLFVGGWFDLFNQNTVTGYELSVKDAPTEEIAKGHRLIMGPWNHSIPTDHWFGDSSFELRVIIMEWIQRQMMGVPSEFFDEVPVAIYVMGENKWRAEKQWPLPDAVTEKFYLHSEGSANTLNGDGTVSKTAPATEKTDTYLYDPAKPILNLGGCGLAGIPDDQKDVEIRDDVLVYTSAVMEEDMEVTGYIKASFYAATSATDTDFMVRVIDVDTDGVARNVVTSGRRARYVKNGRTNPTAVVPGEILKYEVEFRATSHVFKKGHKLRIDICSSDARFYDINPNAFIDLNTASSKDYVVATQTIYHDAEHPAVIELPVIPASHERNWFKWPFDAEVLHGIDYLKDMKTPYKVNEPTKRCVNELPCTTPQNNSIEYVAQEGELQGASNDFIRF